MVSVIRQNQPLERETMIYEAFINYCQINGDKRAFDLITELHIKDSLKTRKYCQIIHNKAQKDISIDKEEISDIREKLISQGLAMILYPIQNGSHSVVVGVDKGTNSFFVRDPIDTSIAFNDFLQTHDIFEYIYFN
ncbi:MAG: hypothetical protein WAO19_10935 [Candidatus Kryptoniota bacterium]